MSTVFASVVVIQVVDGNRLMNTPYDLSFRADRDHVSLCSRQLTQNEIQKFRKVPFVSFSHCYNMSQGRSHPSPLLNAGGQVRLLLSDVL